MLLRRSQSIGELETQWCVSVASHAHVIGCCSDSSGALAVFDPNARRRSLRYFVRRLSVQ